jgi:hypothetical protein
VLNYLGEHEIGILLYGDELKSTEWRAWVDTHGKVKPSEQDGTVKKRRNQIVEKRIFSLVKQAIEEDGLRRLTERTAAASEKPSCFIIAIDEVGGDHHLVRALCAAQVALNTTLPRALGGVPVRLIAIGTGIDSSAAAPGSARESYFVQHIPANGQVWDEIMKVREIPNLVTGNKTTVSPQWTTFFKVLDEHPDAKAMAQNSRVAAIVYEQALTLPHDLLQSVAARPSSLRSCCRWRGATNRSTVRNSANHTRLLDCMRAVRGHYFFSSGPISLQISRASV